MPELYYVLIVFIFGLIVGSFLNCVIYRLEQKESFLKGRSYCPNCKHQLFAPDLIPVLSFLSLKGRCRYCRRPISWQYPLVELATGFVFTLVFHQFSTVGLASVVYFWAISSFLIIIFLYDLKHYLISDKVIYTAIALSGAWYLISGIFYAKDFAFSALYSAGLAALFFFLIVLVSKGKWMGEGDVKLAFFMGLFLGWPKIIVALFIAFFTGAIIGIGLMVLKKKTLKSEIPFGPFLVLGTFAALLFGEKIINWYLNLVRL